jgi:hypothetical protein
MALYYIIAKYQSSWEMALPKTCVQLLQQTTMH